jgi:hypothetical protein
MTDLVNLMPAFTDAPLCYLRSHTCNTLDQQMDEMITAIEGAKAWTGFGHDPFDFARPHGAATSPLPRRNPGSLANVLKDPKGLNGYGSVATGAPCGGQVAVGLQHRIVNGADELTMVVTWTAGGRSGVAVHVPCRMPMPAEFAALPRPGRAEALHVARSIGVAALARKAFLRTAGDEDSPPALAAYDELLARLAAVMEVDPACGITEPQLLRIAVSVANRASPVDAGSVTLSSISSTSRSRGPMDIDDASRRLLVDAMPEGWSLRVGPDADGVGNYHVEGVTTGSFLREERADAVETLRFMQEFGLADVPTIGFARADPVVRKR